MPVWEGWHWKRGITNVVCWVGYDHSEQRALALVSVFNLWLSLCLFFKLCFQRWTHFYKGLTWKTWYFIWCCSDGIPVYIWETISSFKIVGFVKGLLAFRFQGQFLASSTWNRRITQLFTRLHLKKKNKNLLVQLPFFSTSASSPLIIKITVTNSFISEVWAGWNLSLRNNIGTLAPSLAVSLETNIQMQRVSSYCHTTF